MPTVFFVLHSKKRIASIIVLSVIIAAGALFTGVYDVLYKYTTTNTTILNAATVDKRGLTYFDQAGPDIQGNSVVSLNFDQGTYMVVFNGQTPYPYEYKSSISSGTNYWRAGSGAACLAFYKGNNMTVTIGEGGGIINSTRPEEPKVNDSWGGGKTLVATNFALPMGYSGELTAIAAGGGSGTNSDLSGITKQDRVRIMDGTFAGWSGGSRAVVLENMGVSTNLSTVGTPASQDSPGFAYDGTRTPNTKYYGGGAGYYDGGGGDAHSSTGKYGFAGGGSCTPWCYPIYSSDIQNGPRYTSGDYVGDYIRHMFYRNGAVRLGRIDPTVMPKGKTVVYGNNVILLEGGTGAYTPVSMMQRYEEITNYNVGIRVGWVYSCSEDGEKWGAGSDRLRSETEQDVWRACDR